MEKCDYKTLKTIETVMKRKNYEAPVAEVKDMEVLQVLCGSDPGISEVPSLPDMPTESNKNLWNDIW